MGKDISVLAIPTIFLAAALIMFGVFPANAAGGTGGTGTPGFSTHQNWTVFSPNPCPASTPVSIAVQAPNIYVICSDKNVYTYVR
jgi:hypothetical protein